MLIKTTDASYCKIKDVKVSGKEANITLVVYSSRPQATVDEVTKTIHRIFKFYLRDKSGELTPVNNNNYWIDRCDNYNNDSNNVDINLYKEIIATVDISNTNRSPMKDSRWVRECSIVILNSSNEVCWESEVLPLISQDIVLPEISDIKVKLTNSVLHVSFKEIFESQEDFNYINDNLYTKVTVKSALSTKVIESITVLNVDSTGLVEIETFEHEFDSPIIVVIQVLNNQEEVLIQTEQFYNPKLNYKVFTKQGHTIKQVVACAVDNKHVSGVQPK